MSAKKTARKVITLEEHVIPPIKMKMPKREKGDKSSPNVKGTLPGAPINTEPKTRFIGITKGRVRDMDRDGITMQVLNLPAAISNEDGKAVDTTRKINDYIAKQIKKYPGRFSGFASMPLMVPEACPEELERAVKDLGLVGATIPARIDGRYPNDPCYEDFFAKAEELGVPIYMHPGGVPKAAKDVCYGQGLKPEVGMILAQYGIGWHYDAGVAFLHLILSGVFDRHPDLQFILGHWGEVIPYYIERYDYAMPKAFTGLEHEVSYYIRNNLYVCPSGIYSPEACEFCIAVLGIDRVLFAIDYPMITAEGKERVLENPHLTEEERDKIAYKNAERLLGIRL